MYRCMVCLQSLFLGRKCIRLDLQRGINNPVHSFARVAHEEADGGSDHTTWEERKPDNLVSMSLSLVECGETSTENSAVDSRDLVKTLAGGVEGNELTSVSRVEAKGSYGSDCTEYVSFA